MNQVAAQRLHSLDEARRYSSGSGPAEWFTSTPTASYGIVAQLLGAYGGVSADSGSSRDAVLNVLGISRATLNRRRHSGVLEGQEVDRLLRLARLEQEAATLFGGDIDKARAWLASKATALDGLTPLSIARTETGSRRVEAMIEQIKDGVTI